MVDSASALLDVQPTRAFAGSIGSAPGNRVATGPQGHQEVEARQRAARLPRPPQDALQGGHQSAQGHQPVHRRAGHLQGQARDPSAALHRRQGAQGPGRQVLQEEAGVRRRQRQTRPGQPGGDGRGPVPARHTPTRRFLRGAEAKSYLPPTRQGPATTRDQRY